jgi:hypothetical protein
MAVMFLLKKVGATGRTVMPYRQSSGERRTGMYKNSGVAEVCVAVEELRLTGVEKAW